MIRQLLGAVSFFIGLLIVIGFPFMKDYQPESMGRAGVVLGIALVGIGIYLMKT